MRVRPVAASLAAWAVGAAAAVAVGMLALSLIGNPLSDGPIENLNATTVTQTSADPPTASPVAPSSTSTSSAPASKSGSPTASGKSSDRTVNSRGGTVVARCTPGGAYLVGWSPAPGYRLDDIVRGPAPVARVTFGTRSTEVKITISCVSGTVQPFIRYDD